LGHHIKSWFENWYRLKTSNWVVYEFLLEILHYLTWGGGSIIPWQLKILIAAYSVLKSAKKIHDLYLCIFQHFEHKSNYYFLFLLFNTKNKLGLKSLLAMREKDWNILDYLIHLYYKLRSSWLFLKICKCYNINSDRLSCAKYIQNIAGLCRGLPEPKLMVFLCVDQLMIRKVNKQC
jgi:hypothetical protein